MSPLSFVKLSELEGMSIIKMDSDGVQQGDYDLYIESYDSESSFKTTLKTDFIKIRVKE